jgi:GWxTD domain-containing protein
MKKRIIIIVLFVFVFLLFFSIPLSAKKKEKKVSTKALIKRLPEKYKKWLDLVYYIITPIEKKVFLQLKNNRDREIFMKLFWKQRDPTPGTPENEFKDEHIKRFKYANKHFKTTRPGWMTDRGKIYIILGPPNIHNNYDNTYGLYPLKIWGYYGDKNLGLPPYFRVMFYKRDGIGEYIIYDPAFDGPAALLRDTQGVDLTNILSIYKRLKEAAPTIAKAALSLIPGEESFISLPTTRSTVLLSKIYDIPKRRIKVNYARQFLDFKGIVNVDYSMNYIENNFFYTFTNDPETGLNFIHFSIKPHKISVGYSSEKDKYYFAFKLDVSLKKDNIIIYHYSKNYSFYFTEKQLNERVKPLGITVNDMFPIVPGNYKLVVLLQNSVKKEFTYAEKKIKVSPTKGIPYVIGPIPTYKSEQVAFDLVYRPFKFGKFILNAEPKQFFSLSDNIMLFVGAGNLDKIKNGKLKVEIKTREGYSKYLKEYSFNIPETNKTYYKIIHLEKELPTAVFDIKASLYKSNIPIDVKEGHFTISPLGNVPHPMEAFKVMDKKNRAINYYRVANEYERLGLLNKAEDYYAKGYRLNKLFTEGILKYAKLLLRLNKYDKVLSVIESFKDKKKYDFEYFSIKGETLFNKKQYEKALDALLAANKIYDSDYHVINLLGLTFLRLNEIGQALKAFKASLSINEEQPEVVNLIQKIKKIKKIQDINAKKKKQ